MSVLRQRKVRIYDVSLDRKGVLVMHAFSVKGHFFVVQPRLFALAHQAARPVYNPFLALLHQPFGCTRGPTYPDGVYVVCKPRHVYLVGAFYLVAVGVDAATLVEEYFAVA